MPNDYEQQTELQLITFFGKDWRNGYLNQTPNTWSTHEERKL